MHQTASDQAFAVANTPVVFLGCQWLPMGPQIYPIFAPRVHRGKSALKGPHMSPGIQPSDSQLLRTFPHPDTTCTRQQGTFTSANCAKTTHFEVAKIAKSQ